MTESHEFDVVFGVVHATHHTLIISEEEDGQTSHAVNGNKKLPFWNVWAIFQELIWWPTVQNCAGLLEAARRMKKRRQIGVTKPRLEGSRAFQRKEGVMIIA